MRSKDGHYMGATHAGISPPLMGDIVHRTSSREASISTPSSSQRSFPIHLHGMAPVVAWAASGFPIHLDQMTKKGP